MWMGALHPSSEATSAWISFCVHLRSSAVKPPFLGAIPVRDRRSKDLLSRERRSWNMSRIRGKDTTPEKRVRSLLHRIGYRFRLHVRISVGQTRNSEPGTRKVRGQHTPNATKGGEQTTLRRRTVPLLGGVRVGSCDRTLFWRNT